MNDQEVFLCPYCRSPQPRRDCIYCPPYRLRIKMKDNTIESLRKELLRFQDLASDVHFLRYECESYREQCKQVQKELDDTKKRYSDQQKIIKEIQKDKIETIAKVLIAFMFKSSDDS